MQRAGKVKRRQPKMFYKLCHRACIHDYYKEKIVGNLPILTM